MTKREAPREYWVVGYSGTDDPVRLFDAKRADGNLLAVHSWSSSERVDPVHVLLLRFQGKVRASLVVKACHEASPTSSFWIGKRNVEEVVEEDEYDPLPTALRVKVNALLDAWVLDAKRMAWFIREYCTEGDEPTTSIDWWWPKSRKRKDAQPVDRSPKRVSDEDFTRRLAEKQHQIDLLRKEVDAKQRLLDVKDRDLRHLEEMVRELKADKARLLLGEEESVAHDQQECNPTVEDSPGRQYPFGIPPRPPIKRSSIKNTFGFKDEHFAQEHCIVFHDYRPNYDEDDVYQGPLPKSGRVDRMRKGHFWRICNTMEYLHGFDIDDELIELLEWIRHELKEKERKALCNKAVDGAGI